MALPTFEAFRAEALMRGCDEVLERHWAPHTELPEHTHPFEACALVVRGEMWLACESGERHLLAGDSFQLAAGVLHTERYGPEGATYWVGRRT